MAEENTPRVYGVADQANRDLPAAQGMRGEQAAPGLRARDPEFAHMVTLETGKRVPVTEGNGVAYAEATGRVARAEDRHMEIEFVPEESVRARPSSRSKAPLLLGALAAGAGGIYLIERLRRSAHVSSQETRRAHLPIHHETGPLVPVQQLPHQQPILDEISPAAS